LVGEYVPGAKNRLAADFYPSHGFHPAGDNLYELDLAAAVLEKPAWITLEEERTHVHAGA
jgi:predicted enzyme involved in methoxymalonyl-ACP biosynthesis